MQNCKTIFTYVLYSQVLLRSLAYRSHGRTL